MEPNWEDWDIYDELPVFEAACLWLEIEPTNELFLNSPRKISKRMDLIEEKTGARRETRSIGTVVIDPFKEQMRNQYSGFPPEPRYVSPSPKNVKRVDLIKMAEELGVKPKFLYPQMRGIAQIQPPAQGENAEVTNDEPLKTRERKSYLRLIKGLLVKLKIDPAERSNAKRLEGMVRDAGNNLGDDTIRKILKEVAALPDDPDK